MVTIGSRNNSFFYAKTRKLPYVNTLPEMAAVVYKNCKMHLTVKLLTERVWGKIKLPNINILAETSGVIFFNT